MTAVLYDAPGPRAKRRNLLLGVVGVAALLAVAGFVVYRFAVTGQFEPDIWQWILYKNIQLLLLDALLNTLRAFAVAAVLALVFGAVLAWIRSATRSVIPGMFLHGLFNLVALVAAVTING